MKAIFIDANEQKVEEFNWDGNIQTIVDKIGCKFMTTAYRWGTKGILLVDDEGRINGTKNYFQIKGIRQDMLAGNGVIINESLCDESYLDTELDAKEISDRTVFIQYDNEKDIPEPPPFEIVTAGEIDASSIPHEEIIDGGDNAPPPELLMFLKMLGIIK